MELLVASVITVVVEVAKRYFGTNTTGTIVFLLAASFAAAGLMAALQAYGLWETFVQIAVSAAGIWALVIRQLAK